MTSDCLPHQVPHPIRTLHQGGVGRRAGAQGCAATARQPGRDLRVVWHHLPATRLRDAVAQAARRPSHGQKVHAGGRGEAACRDGRCRARRDAHSGRLPRHLRRAQRGVAARDVGTRWTLARRLWWGGAHAVREWRPLPCGAFTAGSAVGDADAPARRAADRCEAAVGRGHRS